MKAKLAAITICLLLGIMGPAQAALTTIGMAAYDGDGNGGIGVNENYKLIWDNDNNGNSVIWLDYSRLATRPTYWDTANSWAGGLAGELIITWNPGITVTWQEAAWRLPSAGPNPQEGYNQTTSEMGHLWYEEFGFNEGDIDPPLNASEFDNLWGHGYWTGTERDVNNAWVFGTRSGQQYSNNKGAQNNSLAIRNAIVTPLPGALWLLGSGVAGLAVLTRRRKKSGQ